MRAALYCSCSASGLTSRDEGCDEVQRVAMRGLCSWGPWTQGYDEGADCLFVGFSFCLLPFAFVALFIV
jgi:hypothetical protein